MQHTKNMTEYLDQRFRVFNTQHYEINKINFRRLRVKVRMMFHVLKKQNFEKMDGTEQQTQQQ